MSDATAPAAGGWTIVCGLQEAGGSVVHSLDYARHVFLTWCAVRQAKKEPLIAGNIHAKKNEQNLLFLVGASEFGVDQTRAMLCELGLVLVLRLGQKQLEIHVAGQIVSIIRHEGITSPNVTLQ